MIPIFKSHYSVGKSILTFQKAKDPSKRSDPPFSIIDIALQEKISPLFIVDDNMSGFMEAYTNCSDVEIPIIFGLRLIVTSDIDDKNEDSLKTESKIIILPKNSNGFYDLCKISTIASTNGFYYQPRIDYNYLNKLWTNNLKLCIPFYDSFLFNNSFYFKYCIPDFTKIEPTFFLEDNDLPFDRLMNVKLTKFIAGKYDTQRVKSIYYKDRADFKAYLTYRCIHNRSTLAKPEFAHLSSAEFCIESWKEAKERNEG